MDRRTARSEQMFKACRDRIKALPAEIHDPIMSMAHDHEINQSRRRCAERSHHVHYLVSTPPIHKSAASKISSLLGLPLDIRRCIYDYFLPPREEVIEPTSNRAESACFVNLDHVRGNQKSCTFKFLCLNKQVNKEILHILYENRTFAVHVYGGVSTGGVEFLNSVSRPYSV